MPRISLPAPEAMSPEQRQVYDKVVSGPRGKIEGPLRAALHNAELADRWQALGALLRYGTGLTPRQSEIAILVTGRACQSPFEWYAHRRESEKIGIEPDILDALLAQSEPQFRAPEEKLVWRFARELNHHNSVSDATYAQTLAHFGERVVVELTALIGYYTMVAMTLNAHEIPLPEGQSPAFPLPQQMTLDFTS
ncbi:MAG: carboxymuconolactone decarboxylase family protein [Comamonadaceae bacterium]|nr:MAG: carboxymuconolactone decarboxylase family protein [Comamonadaceae bacterium]